ncbi:hypothetical protein [Spirillospora sp. NPDC047279]|uniref:hypothetical protein n=1 Tax=Spirillospora sp. NPDC047279 TaxID=3155478 RepID=UPI0033F3B77B
MRLQKIGALAALPLALALTLGACGGDDKEGGVATVNGAKTQAAGNPKASADPQEMGQKYAECMRKNGVPMEDPKDGRVMLKIDPKLPKATVDKAMETCRQYSPQQNAAGGNDPQAQERGLKFAECMRKNGVEKFPNPKPGQKGIMINKNEIGDDADLETAQKACMPIMQGGGPDGGPNGGAGQ